ncbi:hypothetical protein Bxe_A2621 [Paraburkholderia xenovorans LB400]|uniref:Uncharacterized protein n=1 Tax=Paraburkholderia xenovorans (strain LB400) TaxID=266265 RepID=Q13ZX8_PARXL|nr:hypothetical protein Bxe_A4532 [Paraburkholderia xenovorans LB400]ABE30361.1 hypothetical protein Bxe_A2621 [Paraburkholderia xenovorans LB400]
MVAPTYVLAATLERRPAAAHGSNVSSVTYRFLRLTPLARNRQSSLPAWIRWAVNRPGTKFDRIVVMPGKNCPRFTGIDRQRLRPITTSFLVRCVLPVLEFCQELRCQQN